MKNKVTPKIMSGFMELLPADQIAFERMVKIIRDTYESYGFVPLDTPVLELSEVLLAKAGGETEKQIYRFTKGDTDICMRFDLTVPFSRFVAKNQNELAFPFRRYHIGKVYRGERPQKGRFREFYQADIDIIGNEKLSVLYDAEIPSVMYQVLTKLGLKRFHIRMNNRRLLHGFYEALGLSDKATDILRLVDKFDKIGIENVRAGLVDLGLNDTQVDRILSFVNMTGSVEKMLEYLKNTGIENEAFCAGYRELETLTQALSALGVPDTHYQIDLKITRGLDYYTGTVYETTVDDYPSWGTICAGGRYDNLAENYTDRKLPGIGMSIGITRLFDLLSGAGLINKIAQSTADVLILPMGDCPTYPLRVAKTLRAGGIKTEVYFAEAKFKNKMAYANKIGVPYVIILGEDEQAAGVVSVKNMQTGQQQSVRADEAVAVLSRLLQARQIGPVINQE
ncbi:MAG: histidine--tRNA ligase [Alphaproteobacteria bacterium]